MSLDKHELGIEMFESFNSTLSEKWPDVKYYAESESKKLAENFILIEKLKKSGEINEEQAKLHHEIQRNSSRTVLLAVEGLGLLAVEQAINDAMSVLKDNVNGALNFTLL